MEGGRQAMPAETDIRTGTNVSGRTALASSAPCTLPTISFFGAQTSQGRGGRGAREVPYRVLLQLRAYVDKNETCSEAGALKEAISSQAWRRDELVIHMQTPVVWVVIGRDGEDALGENDIALELKDDMVAQELLETERRRCSNLLIAGGPGFRSR